MRWLGLAAALLVLATAALILYVRSRPASISVARTRMIHAPPERVFALIEDLHAWPQWAPQDRGDPGLQRSYAGAARGAGAQSDWVSRGSGGSGHMRVVAVSAPREVVIEVDFSRPFVAHNLNTFTLEAEGAGTRLTWSMRGSNPALLRLMSLFASPDAILGRHFEAGLANLAAVSEGGGDPGPPRR
jgi:uncharacterized protein YndB with AHSA1/START domain